MMGGGGSNSRPLNCERSLKLEKSFLLSKPDKEKKPSFSLAFGFGFGFGMLCLSVSVSVSAQTKPKFRYFGFGLNSGFGRSLNRVSFLSTTENQKYT